MNPTLEKSWQIRAAKLLAEKRRFSSSEYTEKLEDMIGELVNKTNRIPAYESLVQKVVRMLPGISIFVIDTEMKYCFVKTDESILKAYGIDLKEGRFLQDVFQEPQLTFQIEKASKTLAGQEDSYQRQIGTKVYKVYLFPVYGELEEAEYAMSVLFDVTDSKMAEVAFLDRDKQYRQLLENIGQVIFQTDCDGNIVFLSPSWQEFSQQNVLTDIGKPIWELIHRGQRENFKEQVKSLLTEENGVLCAETIFEFTGGIPKWAEINIHLNYSSLGELVGSSGTIQDISERQYLNQAIEEQERRYKSMLELLPDMLLIQDSNGQYIDAHVPDRSIALEQPEIFLGKTMAEILPEWLCNMFIEAKDKARQDRKVKNLEYKLDFKGETHFFEARMIYFPEDKYMSIIRDITERKLVEQQLLRSEERWNYAFSATEDGVWDWDFQDGTFFYSNSLKQMLGYNSTDFNEEPWFWKKLLHPDDAEHTLSNLNAHIENKTDNYRSEHRLKCKDGSFKWILVRGKIIERNEKGRPRRFVGTHTDISQAKSIEGELTKLNVTKDKFFSIISHDLRSPFNTLLGLVELLSSNFQDLSDHKKIEYIRYIHQVASSTYSLLDNLLTWSRSQRGKILYQPDRMNLYKVIEDQLGNYEFWATQKSIRIDLEVDESLDVFADEDMLAIIFRNLISNAIKFTMPNKAIHISAQLEKEHVQVEIIDQGIGIAPKDMERLFRLDESFTTYGTDKEKGTGLGLILCKEFAVKNGGDIGVRSKLGVGSTFWFTVPSLQ